MRDLAMIAAFVLFWVCVFYDNGPIGALAFAISFGFVVQDIWINRDKVREVLDSWRHLGR